MRFPEGMNTVIGERGITLSGGQRQRIAIARALLMDPPLFILDDPLSSVDIQTEEKILEGLEKFLKGKTSILITHRIAPSEEQTGLLFSNRGRWRRWEITPPFFPEVESMLIFTGRGNWKKNWKRIILMSNVKVQIKVKCQSSNRNYFDIRHLTLI